MAALANIDVREAGERFDSVGVVWAEDFLFAGRATLESKATTRIILAKCSSSADDKNIAYVLGYNAGSDRYRFSVGNGLSELAQNPFDPVAMLQEPM